MDSTTISAPAESSAGVALTEKPIRLNIGAGPVVIDGYTPLDIKSGTDASQPLPYPDASVDEVYASHVLEHIPYTQTERVLKEWARVLKPGGIMRLAVPDFQKICEERTRENRHMLDRVTMGGNVDEHDVHRAVFDVETLATAMYAAGIGHVQPFEPFAPDTSRHPYSLNLEGKKRWWARIEEPKVSLVLSQPRLCFTDHATRLIDLAHALKFERCLYGGAFWDRDITLGTRKAIECHNPDFIVYSDYDSIFQPSDVLTLIDTLQQCPEAAAVTCVQMSRHADYPLVFNPNLDYSGQLTRVRFGHFGLTVIRRAVFDELPQPWFWSMPGRDEMGNVAQWDDMLNSDADITFWRTMSEYGFPVLQRNDVVIGHMVLCVKWPSNSAPSGYALQPIEACNAKGKPKVATLDADIFRAKLKAAHEAAKAKEPSLSVSGGEQSPSGPVSQEVAA